MDYFFSQILIDLQDRISAKVPEINYIDQDLGQLGQTGEDERPAISSPAVLIDFPDSDYSELSTGAQLGAVNITFQLIFENYSPTWHKVPKDVINRGLEYLKIEQKLFKCLQKWKLDYFTPLIRTNVKSQNNNDIGLRVRTITFSTSYEDYPEEEDFNEFEIKFNGDLKQ
ncbi:hypothetical protein DBR39_13690 [Chryseobacterium sp. KBW03]|uniref:hypothetical protein n=1 Tax=Chryseobacterium sp. KBW03 TaxID=2153362 RepID=UPI000F5A3F3E|nr:hypothetical protein [Chryseobacterium sp. KBW03]RQO37935.1 hypothetical protein DBR39_13690 [Chryseobacterium sp. KBW03]